MNPELRRERHKERWELGSIAIGRAAISGPLFAALVLFNVLEPYAKTEQQRVALAATAERVSVVGKELEEMVRFETNLAKVASNVEQAQWNVHKADLKQRFRQGLVRDAKKEADDTIDRISEDVRAQVIKPLIAATENASLPDEIAAAPKQFTRTLDSWTREHKDNPWYDTVEAKDRTLHELDSTMANIKSETQALVGRVQATITRKQEDLTMQKNSLQKQTQDQEAVLQAALDAAIPAWARGLIKVEQMIVLYPFLLIGIALYMVVRGFATAGHYDDMARLSGWSNDERSDPVLSSLWTLTWRGSIGTATTLCCYLGSLAGLWYMLIEGINVTGSTALPLALPHVIMSVAIAVVLGSVLRSRSR